MAKKLLLDLANDMVDSVIMFIYCYQCHTSCLIIFIIIYYYHGFKDFWEWREVAIF